MFCLAPNSRNTVPHRATSHHTVPYQGKDHHEGEHLAPRDEVDANSSSNNGVLQRSQQPVPNDNKLATAERGQKGIEMNVVTKNFSRFKSHKLKRCRGSLISIHRSSMSVGTKPSKHADKRSKQQQRQQEKISTQTPLQLIGNPLAHPPMMKKSVPASHATRSRSDMGRSPYNPEKIRANTPGVSSPVPPIFCHFSDSRYGRPLASYSADATGASGGDWPSESTTMAAVVEGSVSRAARIRVQRGRVWGEGIGG